MKIYNLLHDAENYRWLEYYQKLEDYKDARYYHGDLFDFFHNLTCNEQKIENFNYIVKCRTIRDKKERVLGDYPCFTVPAMSQAAKDLLEPQLSEYVQFFPLDVGKRGQYYFLNIFNVIDCLDKEKSEFRYLSSSSEIIFEIKKWKFNDKLTNENSKLFIIKNQAGQRWYVNENIKNLIENNHLKGFVFREVGEINID